MTLPVPSYAGIVEPVEWIIRLAMLVVVPVRRAPAAARSWLLLIMFLPIPGLLLYLAIGRPQFPHWRTARAQRLVPFFAALGQRLEERAAAATPVTALAQRLGLLPAVAGNRVELIDDYDGAIDRLVADIDGARHHVRLLVYLFADDATGRRVIDALGRAAARGVACHVLIDAVGSRPWTRRVLKRLRMAGVEARAALPFHWRARRTRRDMRNHRKLFIVDGAIGYAGSQNIVAKDFRRGIVNRELVARVSGPVVAELGAVFVADWFLETEAMLDGAVAIPPAAGDAVAQLLPSGADYPLEGFATLLTWQIHQARRRVVVTTPYFIPDEDLLGALRTAVARGVEVDLIVSAVVDQPLVSLAQRSYYGDLLEAGVRIRRYRDRLLHAKNVTIDDGLAIVGSSNADLRSFQLNEEVSLLLLDAASIAMVASVQRGYLSDSDLLSAEDWRRRPRLQKLGENIARLVSPLL